MVTHIEQIFKEGDCVKFNYIDGINKYLYLTEESANIINKISTNFSGKLSFQEVDKSEVKKYCEEQIKLNSNQISDLRIEINIYKNLLDKIK